MKITRISPQVRDKDRVNISVDGKYRFSLDLLQMLDLGLKVGNEYTDEELRVLEEESKFGKLYTRALEYCLVRPRSRREVQQYLYRKTRPTRTRTGELRDGASTELTERVYERLDQKGYLDDKVFARFWVENRNMRKGSSMRKLQSELSSKGVTSQIIQAILGETDRRDEDELEKIIAKKSKRYDDPQKFMAYLARQGFSYDDIKTALAADGDED